MTSDHVWKMGDGLAALPEVELVAGADTILNYSSGRRSQWGLQRTYDDYTTLLEREETRRHPGVRRQR